MPVNTHVPYLCRKPALQNTRPRVSVHLYSVRNLRRLQGLSPEPTKTSRNTPSRLFFPGTITDRIPGHTMT